MKTYMKKCNLYRESEHVALKLSEKPVNLTSFSIEKFS